MIVLAVMLIAVLAPWEGIRAMSVLSGLLWVFWQTLDAADQSFVLALVWGWRPLIVLALEMVIGAAVLFCFGILLIMVLAVFSEGPNWDDRV